MVFNIDAVSKFIVNSSLKYITSLGLLKLLLCSTAVQGIPVRSSIQIDHSTPTVIEKGRHSSESVITGGYENKSNIFHSFKNFNIQSPEHIKFRVNKQTKNIFARVTGQSLSNIDGILEVDSQSAVNLFLINPHGLVFGPKVSIRTNGSFFASTASSIDFGTDYSFSSFDDKPLPPLLTLLVPKGLSFNHDSKNISVNTNENRLTLLSPQDSQFTLGQTLALIGGKISIDSSKISNDAGQLELAAISKGQKVDINQNKSRFIFDYNKVNEFKNIAISNSTLSTTNSSSRYGSINIYGKTLFLQNVLMSAQNEQFIPADFNPGLIKLISKKSIIVDQSRIESLEMGGPKTNNFVVKTKFFSLIDSDIIFSAFSEEANSSGSGNIDISTEKISIDNGTISSTTFGSGKSGDINIQTHSLNISNKGEISSGSKSRQSTASAGLISIKANEIILSDRSNINTISDNPSSGINSSNMFLDSDFIYLDQESSINASSEGERGNINIVNTKFLSLNNESSISVNATGVENDGGNLTINADYIFGQHNSDITANATMGTGGNIFIDDNRGIFGFQIEKGLSTETNDIDASSDVGDPGIVEITEPIFDLKTEKIELPTFLAINQLLNDACSSQKRNSNLISNLSILPSANPRLRSSNIKSQMRIKYWIPSVKKYIPKQNPYNLSSLNTSKDKNNIVEARYWSKDENNIIHLTHNIQQNSNKLVNSSSCRNSV